MAISSLISPLRPRLNVTDTPTLPQLHEWWDIMQNDSKYYQKVLTNGLPREFGDFLALAQKGKLPFWLCLINFHFVMGAFWLHDLQYDETGSLRGGRLGEYIIPGMRYSYRGALRKMARGALKTARGALKTAKLVHVFGLERERDFEHSGIFDPDGRPVSSGTIAERRIIVAASEVNDELIKLLKWNPELLRSVSPRKFEEIVAELWSRMGYAVNLTPASRDGGFDIYAVKKDTIGTFLFLVECKRYVPPTNVGVEIAAIPADDL